MGGPLVLFPSLFALGLEDEHFHITLFKLVLPLSLLTLILGYRRHRRPSVPLWGLLGRVVLGLPVIAGQELLGESLARAFPVVGGITMISAHIRNQSLCRMSC
ncbi:MAG: hypothetical protein CME21_22760 [Gemmatimonadetes bacterium]|nr:hypothetical protein [Gemmatimonadota bacterium]MBE85388.1 hypothetical protein [Gemmatimonadota bacterium]HCK11182.1 hypothetical protein [Candidatus Latescibacterota bacterium]